MALDADSGKLKWYFQVSPHDTHDFDNTTAPILFDKVVDGKPRKLVSQAARNGFFVTLDRVTGKYLVVKPFVPLDYSSGLSPQGEPIPIPDKDPSVGGSINIVKCHQLGRSGLQSKSLPVLCELGRRKGNLLPDRR